MHEHNADWQRARERLPGFTCVLCRGEITYTATARGVRPLLDWLDSKTDLSGFSVADKVVGQGAAFLYVLLGVRAVWAPVMSVAARDTLRAHGVETACEQLVPHIVNRTGDGMCPMEAAVRGITEPQAALTALRNRLKEL